MLESTQVRLILAAERLYATEGIDRVSLRQIADASGQRNPAAVQYHFGTKVELLRMIMRYRIGPYGQRQIEMCKEFDAQGRSHDVRGLVEASLRPFAELEPSDSHFVRFLAELTKKPGLFAEVYAGLDDELLAGSRLLEARLEEALADLPPEVRHLRLQVAINAGLSAIARAHEQRGGSSVNALPTALLVADLIETLTAFLHAPVPVH
jgi:AcrR family transcriptional regulator